MADEDPELRRRLDMMFSSARPRQGFEEELWGRIESRRSWSRRLALLFRPAVRFAPALAAFLIVVIGAGVLLTLPRGGGGASTASTSGYSAGAESLSKVAGFGRLPAPSGSLPNPAAGGQAAPATAARGADAGASVFTFTGQLPNLPAALPVYRYREPSAAARIGLARALQAQTKLIVTARASRPANAEEPRFTTRPVGGIAPLSTPEATVDAFVKAHHLTPSFPFQAVRPAPDGAAIVYVRQFPTPAGPAPQVGRGGGLSGLIVSVQDGFATAEGPLDLPLEAAVYPLRSAADALLALGPSGQAPADGGRVILDSARLVYLAVPAGAQGFYEPMLLFSGAGMRVLAQLVAPDQLQG